MLPITKEMMLAQKQEMVRAHYERAYKVKLRVLNQEQVEELYRELCRLSDFEKKLKTRELKKF